MSLSFERLSRERRAGSSGSLSALPVACELLRAGFRRMLVMIGVGEESSSVVVECIGKDPVGWIIGDGVSDPLDMVGKLTLAARPIVLQVKNAVDEVFQGAVDDNWWRRRLFAILERVGVLWLQLGNMKDGVNPNGAGETKGERRRGGLGDYWERTDLLLGELACGVIGADVVSAYKDPVADVERRRSLAMAVGVADHVFLGVLHPVA